MKQKIIPYMKLFIGLFFMVMVFRFVGRQQLVSLVRSADPGMAALALIWSVMMISASCLKWYVLLRIQGHRESFFALLRIYFIGYFFTNILPSNVGGDVVRSYRAGRRIGSQSDAAVTVFLERFTGVIFLLLLVIGAPCLESGLYGSLRIVVPAAGAAVLIVVFLALSLVNRPLGPAEGGGLRAVLERFRLKLTAAVRYIAGQPGYMLIVIVLTVLFYIMTWINVYLAFSVFGINVSFRAIVAILPTAMLIAMVPVSMGSLGLAEGVYVFYSGLMGVSPADAAAMGLFLRAKIMLLGFVGLMFHLAGSDDSNNKETD